MFNRTTLPSAHKQNLRVPIYSVGQGHLLIVCETLGLWPDGQKTAHAVQGAPNRKLFEIPQPSRPSLSCQQPCTYAGSLKYVDGRLWLSKVRDPATWSASCDIYLGMRMVPALAIAKEATALQCWRRCTHIHPFKHFTHFIFVRKPSRTKYTKIKCIQNVLDLQYILKNKVCYGGHTIWASKRWPKAAEV